MITFGELEIENKKMTGKLVGKLEKETTNRKMIGKCERCREILSSLSGWKWCHKLKKVWNWKLLKK